jgi:hypothetical protein
VQFSGRKYQCTYNSHVLSMNTVAFDSATGHVLNLRLQPYLYKAVTSKHGFVEIVSYHIWMQ